MKPFLLLCGALLLAGIGIAIESSKSDRHTTVEQKLDYQRSVANLLIAKEQVTVRQKEVDEKVTAMQKFCAPLLLVRSENGDPDCGIDPKNKAK